MNLVLQVVENMIFLPMNDFWNNNLMLYYWINTLIWIFMCLVFNCSRKITAIYQKFHQHNFVNFVNNFVKDYYLLSISNFYQQSIAFDYLYLLCCILFQFSVCWVTPSSCFIGFDNSVRNFYWRYSSWYLVTLSLSSNVTKTRKRYWYKN